VNPHFWQDDDSMFEALNDLCAVVFLAVSTLLLVVLHSEFPPDLSFVLAILANLTLTMFAKHSAVFNY